MATVPPPPRTQAMPEDVQAALSALKSAEQPLVIIGKGMAWSRAEEEVRKLLDEAATFYASVVDDTEARRILSHAERIRSQASSLRIRYLGSGHGEA